MAETKTTKTVLNKDIYGVAVKNHELLKLAYDAYLANSRQADATTLTRGKVRGGGKKPWRQKGTGRARFGSTRNPIWRSGGIVFGPLGNENYTKKLSKTMKRTAIRQALSIAKADKKLFVVENVAFKDGKTANAVQFLEKNNVSNEDGVLLVVSKKDDLILRATGNISNLKVVSPMYLNVFDLMNADKVLISQKSLPIIENWLLGEEN